MSTDIEYMSTEIRSAREAVTLFKILGIKDITTERQRKNGTTVYELPIQQMWATLSPKPLRFATYSTGYVRNISESNSSCYQINKTKQIPSDYGYYTTTERILIPKWEDRLIYLAKFIIKNYYKKPTYVINDYTIKLLKDAINYDSRSFEERAKELRNKCQCFVNEMESDGDMISPDVQVIINGHRYNLS